MTISTRQPGAGAQPGPEGSTAAHAQATRQPTLQDRMRALPSMDRLLNDGRLDAYRTLIDRDLLKKTCAATLDDHRAAIRTGDDPGDLMTDLLARLARRLQPSLRPLINCTGVVVHTNLGRSCLSEEAAQAAYDAATNYTTLEYNLQEGARGQRNAHVEWLLCQLTGAEAAVVVNNNAGAVLVTLATLAGEREAIVSRGELVEIGGSFRIPDIITFAGTQLREIGCTNRTHLSDYERAITDQTAIILKVHPSNYRIVGFTTHPERAELAQLAHSRGVLLVEDLGSGTLIPPEDLNLSGEPTATQCLAEGDDIVTFSGDKLLGGPQIGAVIGAKKYVDKIRKHPLMRALRCDKMTLAAMETTLRTYLRGDWKKVPTLGMITATPEELRARAQSLQNHMASALGESGITTEIQPVDDAVGGGAYPETPLPGYALAITHRTKTAGQIQEQLRLGTPPVITGARHDQILIHLRTLRDREFPALISALKAALQE